MRRLSILLLAALALSAVRIMASEHYLFRMLDTSNGLPDNNVRNMTMLPDGLMCIQTSSMLSLYNGAVCRTYRYNPVEIPYNEYSGLSNAYYDSAENVLWCTSRDHIWIFDLNTRRFDYNPAQRLAPFGLPESGIENLFVDDAGNYWVVTDEGELWLCSRAERSAVRVDMPVGMERPVVMLQHQNRIWMLARNGTLASYDTSIRSFRTVVRDLSSASVNESSHMNMVATSSGNLWIMFDRLLVYYDAAAGRVVPMRGLALDRRDLFTTIAIDHSDNLWVGSARSGVSIVNSATMSCTTLPCLEQTNGKRIYHHTDISKIYVDRNNGVWIATLSEGLLYWHKDIIRLHTINGASLSRGGMSDESVKCMVEDADGTILVGTIRGLLRYDPKTDAMTLPWPELREELCISLYRDSRQRIWVGTFYNGAFCIDKGRVRHYAYPEMSTVDISYHDATPNYNCVRTFYEDSQGNFWISVYGGVGRFDPQSGRISLLRDSHPGLERFMIVRDICDQGDGKLLISGDNGRYIYAPAEDEIYMNPRSEDCYMLSNQALVDKRGLLWIATSEGLLVKDPAAGRSYRVNVDNGLPNLNVVSIAADDLGNIWAATFSRISRIKAVVGQNGYAFAVSSYDEEDGVSAGAFFQKSFVTHSDGNVYFGGAHGICRVSPQKMTQDNHGLRPQISSLLLSGRHVEVGEEFNGRCLLPVELSQVTHIDLKHDESFITFEFSNLNYANPMHTSYRYKLENFDKEWTEIHSEELGRATYTYLEPGDYTFRVMAADNDVDWSPQTTEISLTIHPPLWRSTAAYVLYALLALSVAVAGVFYLVRRTQRRLQYRQRLERQHQREQLDQMKFRFFTNISHELRTPLSLILLPLESVMRELKESPVMPKLETMHYNARQLLLLVNHLLDFRKLEMGGEKLHLLRGNIGEFVENVVASFRDAAQRCGIQLEFENSVRNSIMAFDNTQMSKIVNNILSNALKFTPEGGYVGVRLSQTEADGAPVLLFEVTDTGVGIPARDLSRIFDRFYQSGSGSLTTGSGIGLSLVKQYVEMHGGVISVSSEVNKGSCFCVTIPMTLHPETEGAEERVEAASAQEEPAAEPSVEVSAAVPGERKKSHSVMVVDDNSDFRAYLLSELSRNYDVVAAADGEECLKMIAKAEPDVLVCDVMMPNIDGFEVTKRLKSSIETSHIPVILLTARTSDDLRLEGYETGADAYLTKPFKMDILEARIRNLMEDRQRRISGFSRGVDVTPSEVTITTIDQKLMARIVESVERNIDNPEYSVEELSSDAGMHRMHLYRKLQSLAGMTPSEFIRTMRLKRAAQLLRDDPNLTVAEVSDRVGFNTPKYFTRYFREMFGCNPSHYHAGQSK